MSDLDPYDNRTRAQAGFVGVSVALALLICAVWLVAVPDSQYIWGLWLVGLVYGVGVLIVSFSFERWLDKRYPPTKDGDVLLTKTTTTTTTGDIYTAKPVREVVVTYGVDGVVTNALPAEWNDVRYLDDWEVAVETVQSLDDSHKIQFVHWSLDTTKPGNDEDDNA